MVGKVATQCVAAAGRTQDARFTSAYYKGNRLEFFPPLYLTPIKWGLPSTFFTLLAAFV